MKAQVQGLRPSQLRTSTPLDQNLKSEFWNFRLEDIRYVFSFKLGYSILLALYTFTDFIRNSEETSFVQMLLYVLFAFLHFIIYLVG